MPAKSKAQQRFMGLVKSYQDGDVPASKVSKSVKDAAKSMDKGDVEDYASTKHKGKPEKVKKELKENRAKLVKNITKVYKDLDKKFKNYDHTRITNWNKVIRYLTPKFGGNKELASHIALSYNSYRGGEDIKKNITKLIKYTQKMTGKKLEASTTKSAAPYQTPFAFRKSTYKAITVDDEDDSDELLGGLRDVRKKNAKKDKEQKSMKENLISFYQYMGDFYGKKGLYPDKKGRDLKVGDINKALSVYLKKYSKDTFTGDSLDRERIRDILIKMKKIDPNYDKNEIIEADDHEGKMARSQLERSMKYSKMIYNMIDNVGDGGEVNLPSWVQSYLTKSQDYLQTVFNYLDGKDGLEDKFQEGVTIKSITEGIKLRKGESVKPGMWEVFDNHTGKSIKVVKTASSATRLMNRLMNSGQYNEITTKWVGDSVDEAMTMAPFSSKEARQHVNQDIKKMSKFLGKASQQVIKLMMDGVKGGKYTAMDISRGIKEGPAGRTHFGELGFIQQLWNKVREKFRRYSKDRKLS
jgi:hypothetical protein